MEHKTIDGVERPQIPVKDWGTGKIDLKDGERILMTHITEIHHKSNGAIDNGPSLAFGSQVKRTGGPLVVSEISLFTLDQSLQKLGYRIVPAGSSSL